MAIMRAASPCALVRPSHRAVGRARPSSAPSAVPKSTAMSVLRVDTVATFLAPLPAPLTAGLAAGAARARKAGSRSVVTMGLFGLGLPELVVIGGVAAVLFGPSKLPELGKSLGKTVKSFQEGATEFQDELKKGRVEEEAQEAAKAAEVAAAPEAVAAPKAAEAEEAVKGAEVNAEGEKKAE
mmetsp:Transcript_17496/g.43351  ORF Transcript_17496/g.43351 Transcript_17496/m.43351 type:complete len:182 (-) Transcript_17496:770-1315(-)